MEWKISTEPVAYEEATALMEARAAQIRAGEAPELAWLLEHPPLYTAGTSAKAADLIDTLGFPVHQTGRGGQYTYHGPGQRIAYVMLDLKKRNPDVRWYVKQLEQWIIDTLASLGVTGERREGRIGIWVKTEIPERPRSHGGVLHDDLAPARGSGSGGGTPPDGESKIAALGVRLQKWVTTHGIAINVNPDLTHYRGIVPCGISEYGVTSLAALGKNIEMKTLDDALKENFKHLF